jgi:protease-4
MASDVVAEAMRKCAERKPVIVSQGDVAASGGYWISMYGTKIYALPTTITGSIGVIGGWMWDKGLTEKLGQTSDHVQVGKHADLGFGARLLLMGPMIPKRNLTDDERERLMKEMRGFYDVFVGKVATGRKMSTDDVYKIAEGHVFSGNRGKEIGLVDEIGGIDAALRAAKAAAGIPEDESVEVVELPKAPLFDLRELLGVPGLPFRVPFLGESGRDDAVRAEEVNREPEWMYIRAIAERPGAPLYMVPPEYLVYEAPFGFAR